MIAPGGYSVTGTDISSDKISIPASHNGEDIVRIADSAFYGFDELEYVYIPQTVTSIGEYAFKNCSSLKIIEFGGTESDWNRISKGKDWDIGCGNYKIICQSEISK